MGHTLNELRLPGVPQKIGFGVYIFLKTNSLTACVSTSGDEIVGKNIYVFENIISANKGQYTF
nr:unnamed protein product [Callosobruchus analis]